MAKITYNNKVAIQNDESISVENKVMAEDMNEIKEVVNVNEDDLKQAQEDIKNIRPYDDTEIKEDIAQIQKEQTISKHTVPINELIPKETEYTLPCNYKVGNNSLRVHWENVLLEEGENGNYMEIGDKDSTSNKIKFGWDIEPGETLIIEVRGVVDE